MEERIKIVVDDAIPFIEGVFEPYAEVVYRPGKEISRQDVMDADALVIRTRTKCGPELLDGTKVKFIATATIGTDHIDLGIVGVGNVGRRVERMAGTLGFKVLKNDPPRMKVEGADGFCQLDDLLEEADIVTMHVPLDETTRGMCDKGFFSKMKPGAIFINASRGEVVVDQALKDAIPKLGPVILDTWNNEPDIDLDLLGMVDIATPHIAGYSYQGKQNGTAASVRALARFFGFEDLYEFFPKTELLELESIKLDLKGKKQGEVASVLQYNYPIFTDDFMLRMDPGSFEKLRSNYKYRREFYTD